MKLFPCLILAALVSTPVFAQNVGLSLSIGEPGYYGRLDIGNAPRPRILYRDPVIIERRPVRGDPIYLRVPPGQARHWKNHCREYNACGQPVYFVQDDWYNTVYAPHYREQHGRQHRGDHDRGHDDHYDDGHDNKQHHDNGRGNDHGHDRGNGHH